MIIIIIIIIQKQNKTKQTNKQKKQTKKTKKKQEQQNTKKLEINYSILWWNCDQTENQSNRKSLIEPREPDLRWVRSVTNSLEKVTIAAEPTLRAIKDMI